MGAINWTPSQSDAIYSKNKSIAVSAAAGSGKTAVLTRRIIEHICDPDSKCDITKILVVTFTTEAAHELMSRISDALTTELAENPDNSHIRMQSMLLPSAKISTIDSFCLGLIRSNFQKLDIPAKFAPASENEMTLIKQSVMEELIDDCFENELMEGETMPEDFPYFADAFGGGTDLGALGETMLSVYDTFSSTILFLDGLSVFADEAKKTKSEEFMQSIWGKLLQNKLLDFCQYYEKIYRDALDFINSTPRYGKLHDAFDTELREICRLRDLVNRGGTYQEIAFFLANPEKTGFKSDRENPIIEFYKDKRTKYHADLKKLYATYFSFDNNMLAEALHKSEKLTRSLQAFLQIFEKRFHAEKNRRKCISFNDMSRYALSLLWDKEKDAPTDLALSIRNEFDEIYVDEYQDTNEIQNKIFALISKENNRFIVGDIKQSIYAFRAAEPTIFQNILNDCPPYTEKETANACKIYLSDNFRSTKQILQFCNVIFDKLMNITSTYGEADKLYCGSNREGPIPELHIIPINEQNKKIKDVVEPQFVAEKIDDLLKNGTKANGEKIHFSDIAVLVRSKKNIPLYEAELKKRNIPYQNVDAASILESAEVLLILSFLTTLDNPRRDIPLAATLKSPLYGVSLDELLYIRRHNKDGTLYDALKIFTEETGFAKGKKFFSDMEKYSILASELSSDNLLWQIYNDFSVFSMVSAEENRPMYEIEEGKSNLIMLYNYAREFEKGGYKGLPAFIAFVNDLINNKTEIRLPEFASPGETIRIMTVHGSKGLEFPICFLCEVHKKFNQKEIQKNVMLSAKYGVYPCFPSENGIFCYEYPMRSIVKSEIYRMQIDEEIRILYVALTRAKERLILTAKHTETKNNVGLPDLQNDISTLVLDSKYYSRHKVYSEQNWLHMLLMSLTRYDGFQMHLVETTDEKTEVIPEETKVSDLATDDMTYYEAKTLVDSRLNYEYPYKHMLGIPSKLSVSRLYPEILDDSREGVKEVGEIPTPVPMPHFLMTEPDEKVTAAEKGTAMHTFMQFCDFENILQNGSQNEKERLLENRFLFPSDAEKIDLNKIDAFFTGTLAKEMLSAKQIFREKRFMITFPAYLFSEKIEKELLQNEKLLVQGVIDCAYIKENGELILVDYKTDSFKPDVSPKTVIRILRERHTKQLSYYAEACRQLFGQYPDHTYVYSFHLDDTVEIYPYNLQEKEHKSL